MGTDISNNKPREKLQNNYQRKLRCFKPRATKEEALVEPKLEKQTKSKQRVNKIKRIGEEFPMRFLVDIIIEKSVTHKESRFIYKELNLVQIIIIRRRGNDYQQPLH